MTGFEGGFIPKPFQGLHVLFSGSLSWSIYFLKSELFAHEANLKKKRSEIQCDSCGELSHLYLLSLSINCPIFQMSNRFV